MANSGKKLVVVLGATGSQGLSIIEYLFKHSSSLFRVRAVTRDPTSSKAQSLASLGAEVTKADLDDEPTLRTALEGANAVFALTDFYDKMTIESELSRGLRIAKIASELPDLEHFVLSSLPDARTLFGGKYQFNLPYNSKAYIKEGIEKGYPSLWGKTTALYISFYYQNWLKYPLVFGPMKRPDGSFVLSMPYPGNACISTTSSLDTGVVVDAILRGGSKYYRKPVGLITERLTEEKRLQIWAEDEYRKRMESVGFPPILAQGMTELAEVIAGPENYVEAVGVVKGRE
ncbi:hypothetical protein Egran_06275, partial [Elaphomyces granulatus]